jgi:hypothetical protein
VPVDRTLLQSHELEFECRVLGATQARPATVAVLIDGKVAEKLTFTSDEPVVNVISLPDLNALGQSALLNVKLCRTEMVIPAALIPGSTDRRQLGVMLRWLSLAPEKRRNAAAPLRA